MEMMDKTASLAQLERAGAGLGLLLAKWRGDTPEHASVYGDLQHTFTTARDAIVEAVKSGDWTEAGRTKEILKHATAAKRALKPHEDRVAQATARIAELRSKALAPSSGQRGVEELLQEREVRDRLVGLDALRLRGVYLDAAANGDDALVHAVNNAPTSLPMVPPEVRAKADEYRVARSGLAADIAAAEEEAIRLKLAVTATRDELASLLGRFGMTWAAIEA